MAARKKRPKRKIGKKSRPKKKKKLLRKIAKYQALLTVLALVIYLATGFWLGPGALRQDIEGKVAGASTILSLHIAGPPAKPIVASSSNCNESDPYILLDWDETNDTDDYDIYRDGILLISGVTNTYYRDENVAMSASHDYYIIANGPLGTEQSDTVNETAPNECYVPPPPTPPTPPTPPPPPPPEDVVCRITTLDKIDLANFRCLPKTKKKKPFFAGTTNVSGARIQAEISSRSGKRKVISSFTANENGYWSWGVRGQLKKTTQIISVRSTDPNDSSRFATCSLLFKIGKAYSRKKMKKCTGAATLQALSVPPNYKFSLPLALRIKKSQRPIFAGDTIEFETDTENYFSEGGLGQGAAFQLIDSKNNTVYGVEKNIILEKDGTINESLKIPLYVASGQYKIIAQFSEGEEIVTAEEDLAVREKPAIALNSTWELTYAELLSHLGWAAIFLIMILLAFFSLLALEYHLSQYAVLQVTEKNLKKEGYID
ncbi:MAG: seg [Candidatus Moranbacteria bacterium GW2011_GWC1_45_18]|nr:MAG: hypothetical protein UW19_C0019G0027 [Candidatus Moranbacteria bacterium GW2011_GWF2_44_10]KKT72147.1 MAG: hypothetical protein UW66_C0012G0006 [Candidatus Moranbacteria bacterium GW2011_GWF1_44_4]KKT99693.1 MAG: seg [Candidatus Moranbacteria bacterium GW2011_GWC1_45_18]OGI35271.1 MAG: hypothetical protein A2407_01285 [Candidatus Moranbacteria bacterium RIFOXYC1_FULL_44_8]HBB36516.1 hypothetical protein [Candidatus Moranbacteria bacterium]